MNTNIYILELENNKYYIGKTDDVSKRYEQHVNGNGSYWTKINKPISIIKTIENCSVFDEDKYVKEYMFKYGINNVRGGTYNQIKINDDIITFLENEFKTSNNLCYKCGGSDHFVEKCTVISIENYINHFKLLDIHRLNAEIDYLYNHVGIINNIHLELNNRKELLINLDTINDQNLNQYSENIEKYYKIYCKQNKYYNSIDDINIKYYECIFEYYIYKERIIQLFSSNTNKRRNLNKEEIKLFENMECEKLNTNLDNIDLELIKRKLKAIMKLKYLLIKH
jgi:predicted GIY-YIG superfamily endonuclease